MKWNRQACSIAGLEDGDARVHQDGVERRHISTAGVIKPGIGVLNAKVNHRSEPQAFDGSAGDFCRSPHKPLHVAAFMSGKARGPGRCYSHVARALLRRRP